MKTHYIHSLLGCSLLYIIPLIILSTNRLQAQVKNDTLTTVVVSESGKKSASQNGRFSPGTRIEQFKEISKTTSDNSLGDLLKRRTSLYIKEYGRGMSSYISLRGTSSSHTSIEWNGQSLSVPTMGQTDLSHIPLYFFDNMTLHIGGNSTIYGNGSIGGNIQLKTEPEFKKGVSGDVTLKGGSFSTLFGGSTIRVANERWESRTGGYWSYAKNNYKFRNNTKVGHPTERLNNSAYNNWGAIQELFHRFRDNSLFQFSFIYLNFDREIQPSVSNNDVERSYNSILDRNTKVSLNYSGNRERWHYNARAAYNYDYELYKEDIIAANRLMASGDAEYRTQKLSIKAGGQAEFIKPDVDAYKAGTREWRGDLFLLAIWRPLERLTIGGGLRSSFVTDMDIPLQPSLDIKFRASDSFTLRGALSRSAKIPTLNDRYWGGSTNEIKPETGITCEIGSDFAKLHKSWEFRAFTTLYISDVKDWIRWLPAGEIWRPQNVPSVGSHGIESGIRVIKKWMEWRLEWGANYNYTNVETKESLIKNDPSEGHQMAYQPKHTVTTNILASYRRLAAEISCHYVGERTSTDIYDVMEGYSLLDMNLSYKANLFGQEFTINGELNNILNTNYQNVRFYAMPGINFVLALQWNF